MLSLIHICGVNDLPLSMVLSWYEQKAVCILLTLLHLGVQNIRLGPTLPAFLSPGILQYLVKHLSLIHIWRRFDADWVRRHGVIIHYFGKNKPWKPGYRGVLGGYYHQYDQIQRRLAAGGDDPIKEATIP